MDQNTCYHCGDPCSNNPIFFDEKSFCCHGCKTVYSLFKDSDLEHYYTLQKAAGSTPKDITSQYDYLEHEEIKEKLLDYRDADMELVNLYIPQIHCSSCIWVLENLNKLDANVIQGTVDFPKKTVKIQYNPKEISLKSVVILLASIGYEPYISLADYSKEKKKRDRSMYYKLGVAGFAFGNVMFLSFPEYFNNTDIWIETYKPFFRGLMFFFSLPVVFYAAQDYFVAAYKGLRSKFLNIDVPIALGISVLFLRSSVEIFADLGPGYFDSLTGLVFFLLIGKYFQQKTYSHLSFDRDFNSYFPIAVTRLLEGGKEQIIPIHQLEPLSRILIRNGEIIPADGVLLKGEAEIDYAYVTGESKPIHKYLGDKLFAGGRQLGGAIEIETTKSVSQSYLTQLWSHDSFDPLAHSNYQNLTDRISKHFTIAIIAIAFVAASVWFFIDSRESIQVFTAVLIVACPCALALAAPFTLGNLLRIFGELKCYLKDSVTLEKMAHLDSIVFDKTGTLTKMGDMEFEYLGTPLSNLEKILLSSTLRASNHPLSRSLYSQMNIDSHEQPQEFKSEVGKGVWAQFQQDQVCAGSASFTGFPNQNMTDETAVHCSINGVYKGKYTVKTQYRDGIAPMLKNLSTTYQLFIVSGDNEGEKEYLQKMAPSNTQMYFNQKPKDKLDFIQRLQKEGKTVLMIGDGLNDAGALKQSDVGIAITEDIAVFTPASDGILDASHIEKLPQYLGLSKKGLRIIKWSLILSLLYNFIGISFAVLGLLKPVIAALLMPISSISVVVFTTLATKIAAKNIQNK